MTTQASPQQKLSRRLNMPLLILYGLGTTIGAGIYALLGDIARTAGTLAPWSFLLASTLAALTAASFAELSNRYPKAGATALYIENGFRNTNFATLIGLLLVCSALTSGAALTNGLIGYAQVFSDISREWIILLTVGFVTLVCLWGISQSAWVAGAISILEVGGVLWMSTLATNSIDPGQLDWSELTPSISDSGAIFSGAVLSFYAYIGFEDMVEVAEEVTDVRRTLPRAIMWTLCITSALYLLLMTTTQLAVGTEFLSLSHAPFADVYRELTHREPVAFMLIGLLAILNGVLIQVVMASRVLYGMASREALPAFLAKVSSRTHTPVAATLVVAGSILAFALAGSLGDLARITSLIMMTVFGLANFALWRIKGRHSATPEESDEGAGFRIPRPIPLLGAIVCLIFVALSILDGISLPG